LLKPRNAAEGTPMRVAGKERDMARTDFFTEQIYISLAGDESGFVYRVQRFGLFGRRRFVATSTTESGGLMHEKPTTPRTKSRKDENE
jgi:hypothetical protein